MIRRWYGLVLLAGGLTAEPALADLEHVCSLGETIRRVEVRYAGDAGRPPCEVVYTKETEAPGREEVLWSATRDRGFCEGKVAELTRLLETNGWQCRPEGRQSRAEEVVAPPAVAARAPAADRSVPLPPPPRPEQVREAVADDDDRPPESGSGEIPQVGPVDEPVRDLERVEAADDDEAGGVGGIFIPAEALEAAVERDLARLKKSADDSVEASVGSFGDLNDDQIDDAAVLITFDADGNDHAQYLVAYVAEGGTYRPAASRFIGGRYRKIFGADVKTIRDGRIELDLRVLEPEDLFCCPSGTESAGFVLENGELISVP